MKAAAPITTGWSVAAGPHMLGVAFSFALSCGCHMLYVRCWRVDN